MFVPTESPPLSASMPIPRLLRWSHCGEVPLGSKMRGLTIFGTRPTLYNTNVILNWINTTPTMSDQERSSVREGTPDENPLSETPEEIPLSNLNIRDFTEENNRPPPDRQAVRPPPDRSANINEVEQNYKSAETEFLDSERRLRRAMTKATSQGAREVFLPSAADPAIHRLSWMRLPGGSQGQWGFSTPSSSCCTRPKPAPRTGRL